jgi:hypothetical protein
VYRSGVWSPRLPRPHPSPRTCNFAGCSWTPAPRVGVQKFFVCRSCENRCSQNIENRRFAGKY